MIVPYSTMANSGESNIIKILSSGIANLNVDLILLEKDLNALYKGGIIKI